MPTILRIAWCDRTAGFSRLTRFNIVASTAGFLRTEQNIAFASISASAESWALVSLNAP
jgi:hypothetical protein